MLKSIKIITISNTYPSPFPILCKEYKEFVNEMKDDLTAKIIETHRDVKWICRTLEDMKETDTDVEYRLRTLEGWQAEKAGAEKRMGGICAGLSGITGGLVAWLFQLMG